MEEKSKTENKSEYLLFGRIPLIAIIFPPIGMMMLLQYFLKKKTEKED